MSSHATLRCKQERKLIRSTTSFAVISSRDTIPLHLMNIINGVMLSIDLIDSNDGCAPLTNVEITPE